MLFSFLKVQVVWIVQGVVSAMIDSGKSKRDFIIEMDFFQHDAASRQDKFRVKEVQRLNRGEGLPDWFPVEADARKVSLKEYKKLLKIATQSESTIPVSIRQPPNFLATELMHSESLESVASDRCLNAFAELENIG